MREIDHDQIRPRRNFLRNHRRSSGSEIPGNRHRQTSNQPEHTAHPSTRRIRPGYETIADRSGIRGEGIRICRCR